MEAALRQVPQTVSQVGGCRIAGWSDVSYSLAQAAQGLPELGRKVGNRRALEAGDVALVALIARHLSGNISAKSAAARAAALLPHLERLIVDEPAPGMGEVFAVESWGPAGNGAHRVGFVVQGLEAAVGCVAKSSAAGHSDFRLINLSAVAAEIVVGFGMLRPDWPTVAEEILARLRELYPGDPEAMKRMLEAVTQRLERGARFATGEDAAPAVWIDMTPSGEPPAPPPLAPTPSPRKRQRTADARAS
jgi:hypothetical protein